MRLRLTAELNDDDLTVADDLVIQASTNGERDRRSRVMGWQQLDSNSVRSIQCDGDLVTEVNSVTAADDTDITTYTIRLSREQAAPGS